MGKNQLLLKVGQLLVESKQKNKRFIGFWLRPIMWLSGKFGGCISARVALFDYRHCRFHRSADTWLSKMSVYSTVTSELTEGIYGIMLIVVIKIVTSCPFGCSRPELRRSMKSIVFIFWQCANRQVSYRVVALRLEIVQQLRPIFNAGGVYKSIAKLKGNVW